MSGHSDIAVCPVCDHWSLTTQTDTKPFDNISGYCVTCGFTYYTKTERMTLAELNAARKEYNSDYSCAFADTDFLAPVTLETYNQHNQRYEEVTE